MRIVSLISLSGGLVASVVVLQAGCWSDYDSLYLPLTNPALATYTDGGDAGPPPGCIPSQNSTPVVDMCGVFVSPTGSDMNPGTRDQPLQTLTAAVAKGSTIYACNGASGFSEEVVVAKAVTLFGALDCTTWAYDATNKTKLTATSDAVPLTLSMGASGTAVHDFTIAAAHATMAGGSSIAVLDDRADLVLDNVALNAGNAEAGAAGPPQNQVATPSSAAGGDGADNTCGSTNNLGGTAGQNMCLYMGSMVDTSGGLGGTGSNGTAGGAGGGGNPTSATGLGGKAQDAGGSCATGGQGSDGSAGISGTGATGLGDVDASGYHSPAATAGQTEGSPGQGGGGGGGAYECSAGGAGPGGGGGGAGGCGGGPGNPGLSGGSSFGILALSASLTLTNVTIAATVGGGGGVGGDGQPGANGGLSGHAMGGAACDGGKGGQGGRGGSGGGGAGGHSAGIAIKGGTLPDLSTTTITYATTAATGGSGGDMDASAQGDSGMTCKTLDFGSATSPCAM